MPKTDLNDFLLTEISEPYELGAAVTALMCWPEDEARYETLRLQLCHWAIRTLVAREPGSEHRIWPLRPANILLAKPIDRIPASAINRLTHRLEIAEMVTPLFQKLAATAHLGDAPQPPTIERLADAWLAGHDKLDTGDSANFAERVLRPSLPVLHFAVAALHLINEEARKGRALDWSDFILDRAIIDAWLELARLIERVVPLVFPNARDRLICIRPVQFNFSREN